MRGRSGETRVLSPFRNKHFRLRFRPYRTPQCRGAIVCSVCDAALRLVLVQGSPISTTRGRALTTDRHHPADNKPPMACLFPVLRNCHCHSAFHFWICVFLNRFKHPTFFLGWQFWCAEQNNCTPFVIAVYGEILILGEPWIKTNLHRVNYRRRSHLEIAGDVEQV